MTRELTKLGCLPLTLLYFNEQAAGCDHFLDSSTKLDVCGVCGGDGSDCLLHIGQPVDVANKGEMTGHPKTFCICQNYL